LPRVRDLSADSVPASEGERFALADRELDDARSGPKWLANPRIAAVVVDTLFTAQLRWKLCDLFVWVLMSNHVHVLLKPHKPLREVTRAIKSASARQANIVLGHTGHPFWQDESYDHWVRSDREFESIARYIALGWFKAWRSGRGRVRRRNSGRSETCPTTCHTACPIHD